MSGIREPLLKYTHTWDPQDLFALWIDCIHIHIERDSWDVLSISIMKKNIMETGFTNVNSHVLFLFVAIAGYNLIF